MMNCTDVRAALPPLIYGETNGEDAPIQEHLAHCPDCRSELDALQNVRRLLDEVPVPRVAVDLPQLHRSVNEQRLRREKRWQYAALTLGALAAVLLFAIGLRLEIRFEATQLTLRWGDAPASETGVPPVVGLDRGNAGPTVQPSNLEAELRVLSGLIHALKQDADERDQRFADRLDRLQKHVHALQSQADLRWNTTEKDMAALYLLTRTGEKP